MGKSDEEHSLPSAAVSIPPEHAPGTRCCCGSVSIRRLIGFRCIFILLLSIALFLSAIFWLPPFHHFSDQDDLDLDSKYKGHAIVAAFNVERPVFLLKDNILQLENDIFDEFLVPSAKVVILALDHFPGSNVTKVVFGFEPDAQDPEIPPTSLSLIRSYFAILVANHSSVSITTSLFGETLSFEVLKFQGGITIIPSQSAFLLQRVQIPFNFTLNFSIHQIQVRFNELKSQLEAGLRLAPYEILYIKLWNEKGSTVAAPTIVQSSVLLEVGNTPLKQRLKQLAQTITGSHSSNLGLNNTEFGKVKQVRLSSILRHSLNGGDGNGPIGSPSPAPVPLPHHYHHPPPHHHHHHHHHHHVPPTPAISPTPSNENTAPVPESSPSPERSYEAKPPGCQYRYKRKSTRKEGRQNHLTPVASPDVSPVHSAGPSPQHEANPPAHASSTPSSSPLPSVSYAHIQPPSTSGSNSKKSNMNPSVAPSPSPSSADQQTIKWEFAFVLLILALYM